MRYYEIVLIVDSRNLTTVLEVVKDVSELKGMKQLSGKEEPKEASHYVGGKRNKGISGEALALELLSDGNIHKDEEIIQAFLNRGFARSSYSPIFSKLKKEGKVKLVTHGRWCLANVTHINSK